MQAQQSARQWPDIVWFLFVSAVLGLTCGVAIGGVALLLASPAYGAEGAEPHGALVLRPLQAELDPEAAIRVAPVSTRAGFHVDEGVAATQVVQTFCNPASASYDGLYAMTLPRDAAVERLRVRVGERVLDLDPLESVTSNLLALEIKDIGPLQAVVVEVDYVEPLPREDDAEAPASVQLPVLSGPRRPPSISL